jgi:hypothetical protein
LNGLELLSMRRSGEGAPKVQVLSPEKDSVLSSCDCFMGGASDEKGEEDLRRAYSDSDSENFFFIADLIKPSFSVPEV